MNYSISKRGGRRILPILLILSVFTAIPLGAAGNADDGYDVGAEFEKANTLIDEGRLDDAIAALVDIAQRDPEQMERVQNMILEVRGIKSDVNELFAELNQAIVNGDEVLADAKIREIKEKDTDPNRNTLNNLILAAIVVSKAINDEIRDGYYERGNAQLALGNYREAVDIYRDGFISDDYLEFYDDYILLAQDKAEITRYLDDTVRQEKIWEAYGTIAPEGNGIIADLENVIDSWDDNADSIPGLTDAALSVVQTSEPETWQAGTQNLVDALDEIDSIRVQNKIITDSLDDVRERLNAILDDVPEDFRYERIGQFMRGRPGREGTEGILLAQRLIWESSYTEISGEMNGIVRGNVESGRRAHASGQWDTSNSFFFSARRTADAYGEFAEASSKVKADQAATGNDRLAQSVVSEEAYASYASASSDFWIELNGLSSTLPNVNVIDFNNIDIAGIDALADPIQNNVATTEDLIAAWNTLSSELSVQPGADSAAPRNVDVMLREDLDAAAAVFRDARLSLYVSALIPLFEALDLDARNAMSVNVDETREYSLGSRTNEQELPQRHPSVALSDIIEPSLSAVATSDRALSDFLNVVDEMLNRDPPIDNPEEMLTYKRRAETLLVDLADYRNLMSDVEDDSRTYVSAAQRAETSGNNALDAAVRDLASARAAVARGQSRNDIDEFYRAIDLYEAIEASLDSVDEYYLEVLVNDVDIAAASGLEDRRNTLRDDVANDRSRLAVSVKTNAVTEAREAYSQGRYAYGIATLNQSQEFWNRSYGQDDGELTAWLTRLRNAQQALSQTVIEPNDPLYAEMNQYLNLANRYYVNGVRIAEQQPGNADALKAFTAAGDLIRQVLNTFPGNEAAQLLEQRILRQTNEDAWNREAGRQVNEARRAVVSNDLDALRGSAGQKSLYGQIKVLRTIEPNYPGVDDLIYDIEVALGIVIPPPDPAVLARSRTLTSQAEEIWDNLGLNGSDRALELLDQALAIWLENDAASDLKNRILLSSEPEKLPAMPAELLNLVSLFDRYFDEGNFILAKALIDRAAAEFPSFASDPRITDRKTRVEARL